MAMTKAQKKAYLNELFGNIPQFLTGAFLALVGGDTGSNDTAAGISIQRNEALGRIELLHDFAETPQSGLPMKKKVKI